MSWWQDLEAEHFEWAVPEHFNIAHACVDVQNPDDLALVVDTGGHWARYTFGEVATMSRKFATVLADLGLVSGDRVGVMVPQGIEVLATHLGAFRSGMVTVPLSVKFGSDALVHRMRDSGAKVLVVDKDCYERVADGIGEIPGLEAVIVVGRLDRLSDSTPVQILDFHSLVDDATESSELVATGPDSHAIINLHLRDDRESERRAPRAPNSPGAHARYADGVRQCSAAGRRLLDAGRLGLDRWFVRRTVPRTCVGVPRSCDARQIHAFACGRDSEPPQGDGRLHSAHCAQADAKYRHRQDCCPWYSVAGIGNWW